MWTVRTVGRNDQPVVSDRLAHVYAHTVDTGELKTIDTRTGEVKWSTSNLLDSVVADSGSLVTALGTKVTALRPNDGKALWSAEMDAHVVGRPAFGQDTVYASARAGQVYAFDRKTGAVKWRKTVANVDGDQGPVVAGTAVIVNAGTQLVALDSRSGQTLWRRDYDLTGHSMVVTAELLIFTATVDEGEAMIALDLKTWTRQWDYLRQTGAANFYGALSASADQVYAANDAEELCAHDITDGTILECFAGINSLPGCAATADGVYATSHNQRLYYFRKDAFA